MSIWCQLRNSSSIALLTEISWKGTLVSNEYQTSLVDLYSYHASVGVVLMHITNITLMRFNLVKHSVYCLPKFYIENSILDYIY